MKEVEATRQAIVREGVVLCVRLGAGVRLVDACGAAVKGGLRVLELTLTTPGALQAMEILARDATAVVGGGTVLSSEAVRSVAAAGGRFVLSPVLDPEVVASAHELGLLAVPGAATPTEILRAHGCGARLVKVFPVGALGGPGFLRALRGPFPELPLLAANGPTAETLGAYLAAGADAVGLGGEVFPDGFTLDHVEASARRVRAAVEVARVGGPVVAPGASVHVTPLALRGVVVEGVSCSWQGGQYVAIVAPRGMVACGIFDPEVCERFGFAVAMAHGTPESPLVEPRDVLGATVDAVSSKAAELGIESGMSGEAALERLLE